MVIISHRGYWKTPGEKNTRVAFERSFSKGFGTETDVRDCAGSLVISHDMPNGQEMLFEDFLCLHSQIDSSLPLALNIKSDGLQGAIKSVLRKYPSLTYFMFDMSLPDMLGYLSSGLTTFARYSEYEKENSLWEEVNGIWLDGFLSLDLDEEMISHSIKNKKYVCIVSPELHGRTPYNEWKKIKSLTNSIIQSNQLILCTDIPEDAKDYFQYEATN